MLLADDNIEINGSISNSGSGIFSFTAVNDININTLLENTGTGSFTFTTTAGDISFVSPGSCEVAGLGISLSFTADGNFFFNPAQDPLSLSQLTTNDGDITIAAANGDIACFGSSTGALIADTGIGTVSLTTGVGGGDITWVGSTTCGSFSATAATGGNVYIGNDSTQTLAMNDVATEITNVIVAVGYPASFIGDSVIFNTGSGTNQSTRVTKGSFTVTANNGNLSFLATASPGNASLDLRSAATGSFPHTLSAPLGSITIQAGNNPSSSVLMGTGNIGISNTGPVNLTCQGDFQLLSGTGTGSFTQINGTEGTWTIGNDFIATAGGDSSVALCYMFNTGFATATLDVGRNLIATGGTGPDSRVQIIWNDVNFDIGTAALACPDGTLQLIGGSASNASAEIEFGQIGNTTRTVFCDIFVQGGSALDTSADLDITSQGGGTVQTGNDLIITGGSGEQSHGEVTLGGQTLDVGNQLLIQGDVGFAQLDYDLLANPGFLLIRGPNGVNASARLLGGVGGVSQPASSGAAIIMTGSIGSFHMEVAEDLQMVGGTGNFADAIISSTFIGASAYQRVYAGGTITADAGTATDGFVGFLVGTVVPMIEQRIEAGIDIDIQAGSSNSVTGLLGISLVDPTSVFPFGADIPGIPCFVRAIGNITATNGTSIYPAGVQNIDSPLYAVITTFPIIPPPNTAYTPGDVTIQSGGDTTLSSGVTTGTTIGALNLNNAIYIEANTQFNLPTFFPGKIFLPDPVAIYPLGQGAVISQTGTFPSVDFTTVNGNISALSAQNDTLAALADYTGGILSDTFHIQTTQGNILLYGFNDINLFDPLTTVGNPTLVTPATDQIHVQPYNSIATTEPITLTGNNFSIGLYSNLTALPIGNIDLADDVTASFTTGAININSTQGYIHQTLGTVSANLLNFTAVSGINNTLLVDQAVRISANFINAINSDQILYLYNTVAGPNTIS
ncbi:MAG: hypothetical protein HYZ48_04795 [Chlamydiales bacterium]|nr:hypothetical protein [Chlamydiales bacterium]